jgi:NAD+ synthase
MIGNGKLMDLMSIDCEGVSNTIVDFIGKKMADEGRTGLCLGISGGVDSAVALFLAARAVDDPKNIHGLNLYDRDSQDKFRRYAGKIAEQLGITYRTIDISPSIEDQGAYKPMIMKLIPYSRILNEMILASNKLGSRLFYGESPFVVTLKRQNPSEMRFGMVAGIAKNIENSFDARHILRREILEEYSEENELLLLGAANRSESFVGWFVKGGVDDLPIEILLGLYKNQVRQLARYLGVPDYIVGETPSPDMFKGIGDEEIIGHSYDTIDRVAYVVENDLPETFAHRDGISPQEFDEIVRLHELSTWKRESKHEYPSFEAEALVPPINSRETVAAGVEG